MEKKPTTSRRRNDILFIAVLLLITAAAALGLFLFRESGDTVIVYVDGALWGTFPLSENRIVDIESELGQNRLIIEDGYARVEDASCPDGICAAHRPVSHDGESIICLPNRVVIEIRRAAGAAPDISA